PDSSIGKYGPKAVIVNTDGVCETSTCNDGWVKTQARTFGDYFIKVDTVPPVIIPITFRKTHSITKARFIDFRIGDALSGVNTITGKIDGKWVLTEWSYKTHILRYTITRDLAPGKHNFDLTVTDAKDNTAHFSADFYR